MVKAGKVMKGFSPQIEEEACVQNEIDEENLERLAILLQALYRGWKARQTLRSQVAAAPPPILRQEVKSERLGATDNTRHAALQYLQEHCIHRLFKNLLSRLYYDKPENAREYILQQLKEIHRQQEMQAEETRRKQGENDSYKASTARDEGPEADIDDLGIFTDRDLAVYFNMLAGAGQHAIPAQQLLKEINRFSLPEDATGVGFKSRGTLGPTVSRDVDKKLFCRTMKRQIGPVLTREKLTGLLLAAVPKKIKGVKVLDLSQNNIRKLSVSLGEIAELGLESVEELILRGNLLRQLDGKLLTFPCLARLDVSENILAQVINFETQFELRELSLYQNRLRDINGLGRTPLHRTLERLDVSRNDIPDLRGLAALVTLEKLKELDVRDNPVESHPLQGNVVLEGFCMLACPLLETLNGHPVTENVRDAVICWSSDDARGRAVASCVYRFRQAFSTRGMDGLDLSGEEVAGPFGSLEEPTYDDRTASHSKTEETCLSQRAISSRSRTVTRGPGSRHQCREEGENLGRCVFAREYRDARENFRLLSPEECVDTDPAASWPAADRGWRPSPRRFISPAQVAPTAGPERARPLSEGRPFAGPPRNGSEIFRSTYSERCRLYPSPSSVSRRPPQRKRQEICPRGWPQRASRVTKATQTPGWWRPNDWEVPGEEATGRRRLAGRREGDDNGLARWATSSVASGDFQFFIKANDVGPPVSAEELRALQAGKKGAGSEAHIVLAGNRNEENEMYQTEGVQEESLPSDWVRQPAYRDYAFQQDAESLDGRQMLYYVPEGKAYSVTSSPTHVFQNDERYPMHNGDVFELTQDSDSPDDGVEGRREIGI